MATISPTRAKVLAQFVAVAGHHYAGDAKTYDDLANANLIRVIERLARAARRTRHHLDACRSGGRLGNSWRGFSGALPHRAGGAQKAARAGRLQRGEVMTARDLRDLLKRVEGKDAELRPGLLQPMSTRRVLLRLQNNIMTRRLEAGDMEAGLRCTEDMLRIAPDQAELWRQSGVLNHKLDRVAVARTCYQRFLDLVPEGSAAEAVRAQLTLLRSILN